MTLCPGKEIILRKYLADQWDSAQEGAGFGFVSQALGHLQQEYGEPGAGAGLGGGWPGDTGAGAGAGYGGPAYDEVRSSQCGAVATSPAQVYEDPQQQHKGSTKLSPKHQIRSPIMEETESCVERALLSRGRQGSYSQLGSSLGGEHQLLQLSLADSRQYEGPEPQYAETKSSILRRRHSNAKLSNNSNNSTNSRRASQRQARRVASLSDLSSSRSTGQHQHQPPHSLRRRSSLSYDDLRCPHTSPHLTSPHLSLLYISTQGSRGDHVALQQPLHQEVLHVHRAVAQGEDRVQRLQRLQV